MDAVLQLAAERHCRGHQHDKALSAYSILDRDVSSMTHTMSCRISSAAILFLSTSSFLGQDRFTGDALDSKSRELAGEGAVDCGVVQIDESPTQANKCVKRAFARHQSYYIRYDLQGVEAIGAGLAGRNGELYALNYDQMSSAPVRAETCPQPVRLLKSKHGRLSCFPHDEKGHGFFSHPNVF